MPHRSAEVAVRPALSPVAVLMGAVMLVAVVAVPVIGLPIVLAVGTWAGVRLRRPAVPRRQIYATLVLCVVAAGVGITSLAVAHPVSEEVQLEHDSPVPVPVP